MKLLSFDWRKRRQGTSAGPRARSGFDAAFYRATYADLGHIGSDDALHAHFLGYGRAEGRFGNLEEMIEALTREHGPLPDDFDGRQYLSLHEDLQKIGMTPNQAMAHFLRHGRAEGRAYVRMNRDLFRALYLKGQIISDGDLWESLKDAHFSEGKLRSGQDVMRAKGLAGGGRWIDELDLEEFHALNADWADPSGSLMQAIDAMLAEGVRRLAPIREALAFDPEFYREYEPQVAAASDEEAYRHWLFVGFEDDAPGSPRQFFARLNLPLDAFPTGFAFEDYRRFHAPALAFPSRWAALAHYVREGFAADARFAKGEGAAEFLRALGAHFQSRNAPLCLRALEAAQRLAPLGDTATQQAGDAYFGLERWERALNAYAAVLGKPAAAPASYWRAARAALNLKQIERTFEILTLGRERVAGAPEWRMVLSDAIRTEYDAALDLARDALKIGHRAAADTLIGEAVARTLARYQALDPLGAPLDPPAPTGRVLILANVDLAQCTHYRVSQKAELLETLGRDYAIFSAAEAGAFLNELPFASAAIFYRLIATPETVRAIEAARAMGVPTYYDIDDLLFDSAEYPEPFETYGGVTRAFYQGLQLGPPLFRAALALCDYAIASTTALAERMKPLVRKQEAFVLPNALDSHNLPFLAAIPPRVRSDDGVVIFYGSGTKAHNSDFLDLAGPALREILARRRDVKLMIVGYLTLDASFDDVRGQIVSVGLVPNLQDYWSLLREADISISPLAPGATTDAKSEIKWIEASALGVACVVSATHRYREVLEDGVDAFLAATPQDWRAALETLIDDPARRREMVGAARAKIARDYSLEANAKTLAKLLDAQPPRPAREAKARVLLVNLFFPPQSLGGSPRVVRDNLDCFLDSPEGEAFEFAVATTDFGGDGRNELRVESYRGRPVFRVSPQPGQNSEWRPREPLMGETFREILRAWRPDLVHFHCVQRFSGSAVEACVELGVPYLVSAHDAWWVSDWQFLTDQKNRLRTPGEPFPFDPPAGVNVGEALDRRRYLSELLHRAEAVLGVSRAFTRLYQDAGFPQARAVPNGVPLMQRAPRTSSPSGRVRLCHIGGMSKFKGFNLVRLALQRSAFAQLELTVVDETRYGGAERMTMWGQTPVRIVGKTLAEDMPAFYARHDVLLAPSLWPEAFGLVSREAAAMGLWVVASDRGAVGEDVTPEVDGFVIDVSTPEPLRAVLAQMNAAPARFTAPPPPRPLRSAQDQAADLLALYRETLDRAAARRGTAPAPLTASLAAHVRPKTKTAPPDRAFARSRDWTA